MINKVSLENRNLNSKYTYPKSKMDVMNPNFKGGLWALALQGLQECEKNPMVNVAVIDMLSAILPRTIVESTTNWFAGFEAFRRESSGLIVNCLIPSFITMGVAAGLNKMIMPKGTNLTGCWADSKLIDEVSKIYKDSKATDKVKDSLREILASIEGYEGSSKVVFKDALGDELLESLANRLKELSKSGQTGRELNKSVKELVKEITERTHVFENIKLGKNGEKFSASTVTNLLEDTVKYLREFQKSGCTDISDFAKKGKKMVKSKSLIGLAIVLPLAASMQYINRWITEKVSGVKGAPIYEDFGKEQNEEVKKKSKEGLLKQKLISISSMIGVSLLSMMKMPSMNMLEFKGLFPTMDQARIISTTTFASRMAAADDKNELAEATIRDIATFSGLYFLGDYAGKATASIIQNKTGVQLLNETAELEKGANIFKKFWHWVKNTHIKSSEEVVSKLAKELKEKGLEPTPEQKIIIEKELKKAVNLRSACQVANLGVSLILLGLIIPIWTRKSTKKKHAEALNQAQNSSSSPTNVENLSSKKEVEKTLKTA